ncbi:10547_t:CDS:2, partial [Entrophospora sp. SA101]
ISAQNKLYTISVQTRVGFSQWGNLSNQLVLDSTPRTKHGGNSGYLMPASTGIQLHGRMGATQKWQLCDNVLMTRARVCSLRDMEMAVEPISEKEIKKNMGPAHLSFMRPAQHMQLVMPDVIRNKCTEFVENFSNDDLN